MSAWGDLQEYPNYSDRQPTLSPREAEQRLRNDLEAALVTAMGNGLSPVDIASISADVIRKSLPQKRG